MSHGALGLDVKVDDVMCVQKRQPSCNVKREQAPLAIPAAYGTRVVENLLMWIFGRHAASSIMAALEYRPLQLLCMDQH